jgi:hypothetical protein
MKLKNFYKRKFKRKGEKEVTPEGEVKRRGQKLKKLKKRIARNISTTTT